MTLRIHPDEIVESSSSPLLAIHPSWVRVRLGEVADVLNGFAFKSASFSRDEGTPLLRIRDVGQASTNIRYVGEYDSRYVVRAGDIVVGMDGDFRVARWKGSGALLNQRVCKISVHSPEVYDPSFLLLALPGYLDAINAHTSSVTVKHLSSRTVQEIPLPLPPLNEQRRVVAAIEEQFSRLDAADESLRQAELRVARLRATALETAVPTDAPMQRIDDLVASDRKLAYGVLQPGGNVENGVPLVRVGDIEGGKVEASGLKRIASAIADAYPRTRLRGGEVLLTLVGTIGRTAVAPESLHGANVARAVGVIPVAEGVSAQYVSLALGRPNAARELGSLAHEVARKTLNLEDVRRFAIPIPSIDEQERIVADTEQQLSVIDAARDAIEATKRRSTVLRRSILERAFRGELVAQDPTDEPAAALLEQISADRAAATPEPRRKIQA